MSSNFSSNVPDLSMLHAMKKKEELFGADIVDLQPVERIALMEVSTAVNKKFAAIFPTDNLKNDLVRFSLEVDELYAKVGFVVFVDAFNVEETNKGIPYLSPVINITGRTEAVDFDFEQAQSDTQHGLMDGIVGRIDEHGSWKDPKTVI